MCSTLFLISWVCLGLKVIPLEKAGSEAWAGVAALDKGEEGMPGWL